MNVAFPELGAFDMENGSHGIDTCMSDPLDVNFVTLLDLCS